MGISHVAVQFPLYERFKKTPLLNPWPSDDPDVPSTVNLVLASTLSKLIASSATYPHEVLRTRLQNETTPPKKYFTLFGTFRTIWREEGYRGLYKGMGTNLVRTVPASAVTLLSYETLMALMRRTLYPHH
jgi:solute carrier family 25 folate transporter 32